MTTTAAHFSEAIGLRKDGFEHPHGCVGQAWDATLGAFKDELGRAAVRAAWKTIGVTSDSGWVL
jgi:hypothetical protein